jgi:hypothetical protein
MADTADDCLKIECPIFPTGQKPRREFLTSRFSWRNEHCQRGTLCKGGSYAQFAGEPIKIKWVIWREPPVHCMARLRLSRLSVAATGDARRFFVGGSTVDSARRAGSFAG